MGAALGPHCSKPPPGVNKQPPRRTRNKPFWQHIYCIHFFAFIQCVNPSVLIFSWTHFWHWGWGCCGKEEGVKERWVLWVCFVVGNNACVGVYCIWTCIWTGTNPIITLTHVGNIERTLHDFWNRNTGEPVNDAIALVRILASCCRSPQDEGSHMTWLNSFMDVNDVNKISVIIDCEGFYCSKRRAGLKVVQFLFLF